ncbi:MAG: winged helix-turn-helix domain-containing protein [Polyangiaceae bacterium]
MTNTNVELGERIERLIQEHFAASRKAAQEAIERAFASTSKPPVRAAPAAQRRSGTKRPSADIAALGERLYRAVCAKPGETIAVLAPMADASSRELHRPMTLLRRAGRVRSVGTRHMTRYFPMAKPGAV